MEAQGQRLLLSLLFLVGLCGNLCYSHANQVHREHADVGFSETDTMASVRPTIEGRPTVLRDLHGYIGVGCCDSNNQSRLSPSPNNYWRILCPATYQIFVVFMGVHVAPQSYLQVKHTKYEGCADVFFTRHYHKKSILTALVSNSASFSAFKMAYVCIAMDKHMLASNTLDSPTALDYFAANEDSLDLFLRFLNDPGMILAHGVELGKILELHNKDQATNEGGDTVTEDASSGDEGDPSSKNLTNGDLD